MSGETKVSVYLVLSAGANDHRTALAAAWMAPAPGAGRQEMHRPTHPPCAIVPPRTIAPSRSSSAKQNASAQLGLLCSGGHERFIAARDLSAEAVVL
jgi:hypothetical protein